MNIYRSRAGVTLVHLPTGLTATCDANRSQHQNRESAILQLNSKIIAMREQSPLAVRATYTLPDDLPCPEDLADYRQPADFPK